MWNNFIIVYFPSLHALKSLEENNSYLTEFKGYSKHSKRTENPTMPEAKEQPRILEF